MAKTQPVTRKPVRVWVIEEANGALAKHYGNPCVYSFRHEAEENLWPDDRGVFRATLTFDAPPTRGKR